MQKDLDNKLKAFAQLDKDLDNKWKAYEAKMVTTVSHSSLASLSSNSRTETHAGYVHWDIEVAPVPAAFYVVGNQNGTKDKITFQQACYHHYIV